MPRIKPRAAGSEARMLPNPAPMQVKSLKTRPTLKSQMLSAFLFGIFWVKRKHFPEHEVSSYLFLFTTISDRVPSEEEERKMLRTLGKNSFEWQQVGNQMLLTLGAA